MEEEEEVEEEAPKKKSKAVKSPKASTPVSEEEAPKKKKKVRNLCVCGAFSHKRCPARWSMPHTVQCVHSPSTVEVGCRHYLGRIIPHMRLRARILAARCAVVCMVCMVCILWCMVWHCGAWCAVVRRRNEALRLLRL